jgi:hypothetical protein
MAPRYYFQDNEVPQRGRPRTTTREYKDRRKYSTRQCKTTGEENNKNRAKTRRRPGWYRVDQRLTAHSRCCSWVLPAAQTQARPPRWASAFAWGEALVSAVVLSDIFILARREKDKRDCSVQRLERVSRLSSFAQGREETSEYLERRRPTKQTNFQESAVTRAVVKKAENQFRCVQRRVCVCGCIH